MDKIVQILQDALVARCMGSNATAFGYRMVNTAFFQRVSEFAYLYNDLWSPFSYVDESAPAPPAFVQNEDSSGSSHASTKQKLLSVSFTGTKYNKQVGQGGTALAASSDAWSSPQERLISRLEFVFDENSDADCV
ncbi:unnamed protein product [Amoebophrya sp. A25]|nr:unnamed protein product [Amoebophrya sp. A25]|eukprot:GSA25T00014135001.1